MVEKIGKIYGEKMRNAMFGIQPSARCFIFGFNIFIDFFPIYITFNNPPTLTNKSLE